MPTSLTPAQAWQKLLDGNAALCCRHVGPPQPGRRPPQFPGQQQNPFAIIFGCSDSRLAAEIIFDLGLGDAFVVRTAGQVIDDAVLGSLEYGVGRAERPADRRPGPRQLRRRDRRQGHRGYRRDAARRFLRDLVERITPSVLAARRAGHDDINDMVVENVQQTSERLLDSSRAISEAVDAAATAVVGVAYRLADGRADWSGTRRALDPARVRSPGQSAPRPASAAAAATSFGPGRLGH